MNNSPFSFSSHLLGCALLLGMPLAASAVVTPVLYLRMGEEDVRDATGRITSLKDSLGNVETTVSGNPIFSTSVGKDPGTVTHSTACLDFLAGGNYAKTRFLTQPLMNGVVELWVQPSTATGTRGIVSGNGWAILQVNGEFRASVNPNPVLLSLFGSAPAVPGTWTHLALVNDQGVTTLYADGKVCGSSTASFFSGTDSNLMIGALSSETGFFRGRLDELRVSRHEPGMFNPRYDLLDQPPVLGLQINSSDGPGRVDERTLDFGTAEPGQPAVASFTIRNDGNSPLTGLSVSLQGLDPSQFAITTPPGSGSLGPGQSTKFTVNFAPEADGPRTAILHVTADASGPPAIDLILKGKRNAPALRVSAEGRTLQQGLLYQIPPGIYDDLIPLAPQPPQLLSDLRATAVGFNHFLGLRNDGTVTAWGSNFYGQINVPSGLADVVQVAAGQNHSLALKSDGTVVGWGSNLAGELDIPAGLSGITAIAASGSSSAALKDDGTVVTWGASFRNYPGIATETNVAAIAMSDASIVLLKHDGTVTGYGRDVSGSLTGLTGQTGIKAIASNLHTTTLLKNDGTVTMTGQLPYPYVWNSLSHVISIATTSSWFYFLQDDGALRGISNKLSPSLPVPGTARSVAAGSRYGAATYDEGFTFPGRTAPGTSTSQIIELASTGSLPLHPGRIDLSGPDAADFSLDIRGVGTVLDPGTGRTRFQVFFHGNTPGVRYAQVNIHSDDPLHPVFSLPLTATCGTPDPVLPVSVFTGYTTASGSPIQEEQVQQLGSTVNLIGNLEQAFTLRNDGDAPLINLHVSTAPASDNTHDSASYFKIVQPDSNSLAPGESTTFIVRFQPMASGDLDPAGLYSARIAVLSNQTEVFRMTTAATLLDSLQNWAAARLAPGENAEDGDPNHNGIPNLLEYALNGAPKLASDPTNILPQLTLGTDPANPQLTLSFAYRVDRGGVNLSVEACRDLASGQWVEVAHTVSGFFVSHEQGVRISKSTSSPLKDVTVSVPATGPNPYRFLRLRAVGSP